MMIFHFRAEGEMHENKDKEAKRLLKMQNKRKKKYYALHPRCQRGEIATLRFGAFALGQQQAAPKPFATLSASHTCQTVSRNSALACERRKLIKVEQGGYNDKAKTWKN